MGRPGSDWLLAGHVQILLGGFGGDFSLYEYSVS